MSTAKRLRAEDNDWSLPQSLPQGWQDAELPPPPPNSDDCIAALLHGSRDTFLAMACVLGRRLRETSPGPDRVLLCGPGTSCGSAANRRALRTAGWQRLLPVDLIHFPHLDKSKSKRHASVFTKLRILELPYRHALLLDLDLLPRSHVTMRELLSVPAPAGKYHRSDYWGPEPDHGKPINETLANDTHRWSPNAGVLRLDPLPSCKERRHQMDEVISELRIRKGATYLPEQYYLAHKFKSWHHIGLSWNWEVWPEWADPSMTHPVVEARHAARQQGWAGYYLDRPGGQPPASTLLDEIHVWHFSGTGDTLPWLLQDLADADDVMQTSKALFRHRDPGGVVAVAMAEWRKAFDDLLGEANTAGPLSALSRVAAGLAVDAKSHQADFWTCQLCGLERLEARYRPDLPWDGFYCSEPWKHLIHACGECVVQKLRQSDDECACADDWDEDDWLE